MIDEEHLETSEPETEDELIAECLRLLDAMEARITAFEKSPHTGETGVKLFGPLRGLDEVNSLGVTFRKRWTRLKVLTPNPPKEIRKRAEEVVDNFLRCGTKVVVPGEPGEGTRDSLRRLLGLAS